MKGLFRQANVLKNIYSIYKTLKNLDKRHDSH